MSKRRHIKNNTSEEESDADSASSAHSPITKVEPSIEAEKEMIATAAPSELPNRANKSSRRPSAETPEARQNRRENHRLIERRRRETINNGINELARVVPGQPKNRGTIILKAVEYIDELERAAAQSKEEAESLKREKLLLIEELAIKNKKINELLLML